ncbi:MAG TPA: phosphodiesterase [Burkholderiaceae bacterium]|nr:phosphodiesterase [Burkholderiaceae bacterium]
MLLCQISDPHIVPYGTLAYGRIDTPRFLERCVTKVISMPRQPDAVVLTGDLTDHATAEEYGILRELLAPLAARMPLYLAVGNHDDRNALRVAFPEFTYLAGEGGFVQYAVDILPVRLVVLDTLIPGAPGGELCADRLRWLDRTLAQSDRPTIVAQHHPPLVTGLTIMDRMALRDPEAEEDVIAKYTQVERIICGHYHRNIQARFGGTVVSVCPSSAHQLMLNLVPGADIRFAFEPSEFHLHLWNGSRVVTHTEVVEDFPSWGSRD